MGTLLVLIMALLPVIDFGPDNGAYNWRTLNDSVMGGRSYSTVELTDVGIKVNGEVSLANNGGFSSIRSQFESMDLSAYSRVVLRCRGEGQSFSFTLETDQRWYYPYYKKTIPLPDNEWHDITLELSEFAKYRVGRTNGETLNSEALKDIIRLGVVTGDKKEGPFEFELDYIRFE